jgi:hypothetical protein
MTTYVYRNGKLVEKSQAYGEPKLWKTSVISDSMEPTKHHGTGRVHDSKSKFRGDTKALGMIETGNEAIKPRQRIPLDRGQRREALRKSIYMLKNGYKLPQFAPED